LAVTAQGVKGRMVLGASKKKLTPEMDMAVVSMLLGCRGSKVGPAKAAASGHALNAAT
jgi:hypothetical protein